jgi:hypothetical protein
MEFILTSLLNNSEVIALIISKHELTSLLFKDNRASSYEDARIDYQTDMNYTPKSVLLSVSIEKEKNDFQKQIDDFNVLISKDVSIH